VNKTFLTGADYNLQDLIPWWVGCVRKHNPDIHITIADFGLTDSAKDWLKENVDHVITYERHPTLAWFLKPQSMLDCPYEYTCWLDLDCEMVAPVPEIFDFPTEDKMALTEDVIRMGHYGAQPGQGVHWWAVGVNVVKGKPQILKDWARNTIATDLRGDQEVLHRMTQVNLEYNNQIIKMPLEYQWLRLSLNQGYDSPDKKIIHWTGPVGKEHIRKNLMR
tara:strand:- start:858 stop:1517 length:660 start_codon:yes stop_codon:yes gene_type:complete